MTIDPQLALERLRTIVTDENGIPATAEMIAKALGYPTGGAYISETANGALPLEKIALFCLKRNILINWILYGQSSVEIAIKTRAIMPRFEAINIPRSTAIHSQNAG